MQIRGCDTKLGNICLCLTNGNDMKTAANVNTRCMGIDDRDFKCALRCL